MKKSSYIIMLFGILILSACQSTRCNKSTELAEENLVFESDFDNRPALTPSWSVDTAYCENPLTEVTFKNLILFLEQEKNTDKRLSLSLESIRNSCMTSYQVSRIAKLFNIESDKLAIAKQAYSQVYDPQNYKWVLDQLLLLGSREEMKKRMEEAKLD